MQQLAEPTDVDSDVNASANTLSEGTEVNQNAKETVIVAAISNAHAEEESPIPGSSKNSKDQGQVAGSAKVKKSNVTTSKGRTVDVEYRDLAEKGESFGTNQAVLRQVFQLYPPCFSDMVNIRRVCKAWKLSSLERWRTEAILKLIPEDTIFQNTDGGVRPTEFLGYLDDAMDPWQLKEIPYTRYRFQGLKIDMSISDKGLSHKFWRLVGCNMRYLHLNGCEFLGMFEKPLQYLLLKKTPKLQEIVVTDIRTEELSFGQVPQSVVLKKRNNWSVKRVTVHGKIPLDFEKFLGMFPNVKELTLQSNKHLAYTSSLLELLHNLRSNPRSKRYCLKKLDIKGMSEPDISMFVSYRHLISNKSKQLGLNLKTLCLELEPGTMAYDLILETLLEGNRNIKSLEFCVVPRSPHIFYGSDQFDINQQMNSLTDLRLWGSVIKNLKFLKFMPNLQRLYMNPLCFEKWPGSGKHLQPWTEDLVKNSRLNDSFSLNFMVHLHVEHELSTLCIQKLNKWMPNLKVLKTILNKETFPTVCRQWPNLKHLGLLFGSRINDETIIGARPTAPPARVFRRSKQRRDGCRAGILNLINLNVFSLDAYCDEAQLSDVSAIDAFLKIPSLVTLKIYVSERMSAETEDSLKNNIPCVSILRNNGPHDLSECCIRREFLIRCNASGDVEARLQEEEDLFDRGSVSDINLGDELEQFQLHEDEDDV